MSISGPRLTNKYREHFKATAARLSKLPGVEVQHVAASLYTHLLMLSRWPKEASSLIQSFSQFSRHRSAGSILRKKCSSPKNGRGYVTTSIIMWILKRIASRAPDFASGQPRSNHLKTATADTNSAEAQSLIRTERHIVRQIFWQTMLSVVGVVIAVLALYAALTESAAVRQQTAVAVWPFVQLQVEDYDTGDAAGFSFAFSNVGVGPAKMRDLRVIVDGNTARN